MKIDELKTLKYFEQYCTEEFFQQKHHRDMLI